MSLPRLPHIHSRAVKIAGLACASLLLALLVFQAGIMVGYRKAVFSRQLGNNFYRAFEGPSPKGDKGPIPGGHGSAGFIASIASSTIVVVGPDGIEKMVSIGTTTDIRRFRDVISAGDLKTGEFVVAIGNPGEDGVISARAIRVLPPPPSIE